MTFKRINLIISVLLVSMTLQSTEPDSFFNTTNNISTKFATTDQNEIKMTSAPKTCQKQICWVFEE